jgi:hypothetical protein
MSVVMFLVDGCGACREFKEQKMDLAVRALCLRLGLDLVDPDIGTRTQLQEHFRVRFVPTVLFYREHNGKLVGNMVEGLQAWKEYENVAQLFTGTGGLTGPMIVAR